MKQSTNLRAKELFYGSDAVRKYTFKMIGMGDSYAQAARANHTLAMKIALSGAESAHFSMDCFECLSPHGILA